MKRTASPSLRALAIPVKRSIAGRLAGARASARKASSISGPVTGVDADVAFREIAGPETRLALAPAADGEPDVALRRIQFALQRGFGELGGQPAPADRDPLHV